MPKYSYQALNEEGNTVTGTLNAVSNDAVNTRLLDMGVLPYKVKTINESSFNWSNILNKFNSVNIRDIIIFQIVYEPLFPK
jgi:type II secretory pathway component PulF